MYDAKALRNTKQRTILLQMLRSTDSHPNADWLYDRMKEKFPNISLSTVYRNLGILEKQGLLLRLPCISYDRYDGNTVMHTHFFCRVCEKVYDIASGCIEDFTYNDCPHDIEGCNVIFYGVCRECKTNN